MTAELKIGSPAPDFAAEDQYCNQVRLAAYKGVKSVLLIFYDFDWHSICGILLTEIQRNLSFFDKSGIQVMAASVDSVYSHRAWAAKLGLVFPLLSDFKRDISRKYGLLEPENFSHPAIIIIDRKGIIRSLKLCSRGDFPDIQFIKDTVKGLKKNGEI